MPAYASYMPDTLRFYAIPQISIPETFSRLRKSISPIVFVCETNLKMSIKKVRQKFEGQTPREEEVIEKDRNTRRPLDSLAEYIE